MPPPLVVVVNLATARSGLEVRRTSINKTADLLNIQASSYNNDLGNLKSYLDQNKGKIITSGLYYSEEEKIDIFTFNNVKELRLLLVHEMGHSLKIGHDKAPASIMYPVLGGQNLEDPTPTTEDIGLICKWCIVKNLKFKI